MPVHDLGYRPWTGKRASRWTRWWVIAETGIRIAWQSSWLRRMLLFAWLPAAYLGIGVFAYERMMQYPNAGRGIAHVLRQLPQTEQISEALGVNPTFASSAELHEARHRVWAWLLETLFRYPQGVLMVMAIGLVAPPLISRDVRSRAFLLYFSRPLVPAEYVMGKSVVVWCYLFLITTVPALTLYFLGLLLSPDLSVVWHTWDLPLRILLASAVLMLPTTALALGISSLTTERRYAGFAWFAIWILGWTLYSNLSAFAQPYSNMAPGVAPPVTNSWTLVSLYHTLGVVQTWIFGFSVDSQEVIRAAILLVIVTAVSLAVLFRRVSAPMRV